MRILVIAALLLGGTLVDAQTAGKYQVPKYSPSYHRSSRDVGPMPGSKVAERGAQATFKRIHARPAGLRLLVRASCGASIRPGELITKARELTTAEGPVVQIDWGTVRGDEVAFWAVASATRKVTEVKLTEVDGTFKAGGAKTSPQEHWEVKKLLIGKVAMSTCVEEKKMNAKDLRIAVVNFLNNFTTDFYRRPSDQFASKSR